jgi:geranylgeranyl diphosphate synthase type I
MELYDATWEYLTALPTVQEWPELRDLLYRGVRNKPAHWWMAARACLATGGTLQDALPAVVALGSLFLNIILIDDVLDDDPKGQHLTLGYGPASNMASALQALGYEAIARSSLPLETQAIIFHKLNQMMLQTTLGQFWDTQNPCDEESYWRVTRAKSSPYFGTSFFMGALMSGTPEAIAAKLGEIGELYGEMVQINDDLNDVMALPANPDWLQGRYPLPILFASLVPHPQRERFISLRPHVREEWALVEAQEILIRSGAISYGIDQLLERAGRIDRLLQQTPLAQSSLITEMVNGILAPVNKLLAQMNGAGVEPVSA